MPAKAGIQSFTEPLDSRLRGNDNMIECNAIFMTRLLLVSAISASSSNANRQIARSTANWNSERRVEPWIDICRRCRAGSLEKILRDDDAAMLLFGHLQK